MIIYRRHRGGASIATLVEATQLNRYQKTGIKAVITVSRYPPLRYPLAADAGVCPRRVM